PPERVDGIGLVQDELDGQFVRADLPQDSIDGRDLLDELLLGGRSVDDVENEVGDERFFERRGEALDELMRQAADESDRVGDEITAAFVLEPARRRIERLEEPVPDGDAGASESVEQ